MKRAALCLTLLFIATVAIADRYSTTNGSLIRIEGTSSLHEWKMEGTTVNGHVSTPPLEQWQNGTAATDVSVEIPVKSVRSEHPKMDKLMAEALKAEKNPMIRYAMTKVALAKEGTPFMLDTTGKLTIAGVTRDVNMRVTGTRDANGAYVLTGQAPIRMSDYGIKPPTAMLGAIKTGNDVKVTFRWAVAVQ